MPRRVPDPARWRRRNRSSTTTTSRSDAAADLLTLDAGGDANRTYLLLPPGREEAWCVDPSYAARSVERAVKERSRRLTHILLTHTHADHAAGADALVRAFACRIWCHPAEARRVPGAGAIAVEGPLEALPEVEALFTPGHTPGSTCYLWGSHLFTGDTLFVDWVGRADLPGGDPAALFASLGRLRSLPGHLDIHPGHDYGAVPSRSLAQEAGLNKFLGCTRYERFLELLPELTE